MIKCISLSFIFSFILFLLQGLFVVKAHAHACDHDLNHLLMESLQNDDFDMAEKYVRAGAYIDPNQPDGLTLDFTDGNDCRLLKGALYRQALDVVKMLVHAGLNINQSCARSWMEAPLVIELIYNRAFKSMEVLLDLGLNLNIVYANRRTPLLLAISTRKPQIVQYLIDAGANVNQSDRYDLFPLMAAIVDMRDLEITHALLAAGIDFNVFTDRQLVELHDFAKSNLNRDPSWQQIVDSLQPQASIAWSHILATYEAPTQFIDKYEEYDSSPIRWLLVYTFWMDGLEALQHIVQNKYLIGVVTVNGLNFDIIMSVGELIMEKESAFMIAYVTQPVIDALGVDAFAGLIIPGASDSYPRDKIIFKWHDLDAPSATEKLYQKVYSLAQMYKVPTFGICAGAQHLVMHRGGALMENKNFSEWIELQPYTPIYYLALNQTQQHELLVNCEGPRIEMNVYRAHSYAAYPEDLPQEIELAAIDEETPLAYSIGFKAFGVQFHPEAYYALLKWVDEDFNMVDTDTMSYESQTHIINGFFNLCRMRQDFVQLARHHNQSLEVALQDWENYTAWLNNRLKACQRFY